MSEKRFTSNKRWIAEGTIVDICDNGKVIMQVFDDDNIQNVVDLLNELAEENEQLKSYKLYEDNKRLQSIIADLKKENEQLKQQLLYDGDDVCGICKHKYLVPSGDYFIGKCKKGHKECSKEDIKYCEDFELIQADLEDLIKRMDKELIVND